MGDIRNEFVPYELADRLQLLGFNEPCIAWYYGKDLWMVDQKESEPINYRQNPIRGGNGILAPTWQSAFRWFREIKEVEYQITYAGAKGRYNAFVEDYFYDNNGDLKEFTYKEAELACLEKLIEIIEQNNKEDETN